MTTEELAKLTPEEKRIRIAELCGWKYLRLEYQRKGDWFWLSPPAELKKFMPEFVHDSKPENERLNISGGQLPDYLNDLNAMHEAEKVMDNDQREQYWGHLAVCEGPHTCSISATAAQRADAFLLTIG